MLVWVAVAVEPGAAAPKVELPCVEHPTASDPRCVTITYECLEVFLFQQLKVWLTPDVSIAPNTGVILGGQFKKYGYFEPGNGGSIFTGLGHVLECYAGMASEALPGGAGESPLSDPATWLSLLERVARGDLAWEEVEAMLPPVPA